MAYISATSSISLIGTNKYRMTITPYKSSSGVWNAYGINVYAVIGGSERYVATFTTESGVALDVKYTYDFDVTSTVQVYAKVACAHCGGLDDDWIGTSTPQTATYVNPNSAPPTPTISCSSNYLNGNYYGESSVVVSLSAVTDPEGDPVAYRIYGQYKPPGGSFTNWNGGSDDLITTDRSRAIDINRFDRGTQFRFWGYAKDSKDAWSGKSNVIENIYKNKAPATPTISCTNTSLGGSYIVEDIIKISLSSVSDPDGHNVSYKIYGQYYDGSWKNMEGEGGLINNAQTANIDLTPYARGTQFRFWGYAEDALGALSAQSNIISNIYKNKQPDAPTISCSNELVGSRYIGEDSISVYINTPGDPEGGGVSYAIYGQYYNGSSWVGLGSGNNLVSTSTSATVNISSHTRGTQYKFWAYTTDNFGVSSVSSNVISNIYKNRVGAVTDISPGAGTINSDYINLSWATTVDPDGQPVTYNVWVSVNDGVYSKIATNQAARTYKYDISKDPKATKYRFKISANDGMADTPQALSDIFMKDFEPIRLLPNNYSKVYHTDPRIVFTRVRNSGLVTSVRINNTDYDSTTHPHLFTTKNIDLNGEDVYVFRCSDLVAGENKIIIYNKIGGFISQGFVLTLTYERPIIETLLSDRIRKSDIESIKTMSNTLRRTYDIDSVNFEYLYPNTTPIKISHFAQIRTAADEIREKINYYDSVEKTQNWDDISEGTIIKKSHIQQLINSLKNV